LRKILSNCSSQIYFPNMWNWTIPHFWEKSCEIVAVKYTSQPCGIEQFHMFGKTYGIEQFYMFGKMSHIWANFFCFTGIIFLIFVHITGMLIQWLQKCYIEKSIPPYSSWKTIQNLAFGLVLDCFNSRESVWIFQCNIFKVIGLPQFHEQLS